MNPDDRARSLLAAAVRDAAAKGWKTLTHQRVADAAGVSPALVKQRLGTKTQMLRRVMRAAVLERSVPVVAEGLALRDPHAMKAPVDLKKLAAAWVGGA